MNEIRVTVYGAEQICASCVGAPGSRDTFEWLQAAINRKYVADTVWFEYIDIDQPPNVEKHQLFIQQMVEEELLYPIVLINDEMVAEGIPRLKPIYQALDSHGLQLQKK
ncbi:MULTISPECIES: YuzD family protein [Virgibacillus]|uniref:DUF1462 family protein n=2 Tax=Virgibacillus TaxID=84406 RepID=A0A024QAF4_9BACI|nr:MULTISPECIES: YuzD family protein [Virgibacillus]EQB37291.1 hypothetical protein M948_01780 [Virgibacillus sp. CM-4]MYL40047.1 DUF1462 family protein [Virgibacillus massiliensis]GGJ62581.1 disulfide oxidoreductase [Virgibacillus kapii]CDQ39210.1 hypothetical protein BN990_01496 [Virgibacillus massiliensis]